MELPPRPRTERCPPLGPLPGPGSLRGDRGGGSYRGRDGAASSPPDRAASPSRSVTWARVSAAGRERGDGSVTGENIQH